MPTWWASAWPTIPASLETVNNLVTTQDYGTPGYALVNGQLGVADVPAYLLGVVYADSNANGQYDVGEGVVGVTVTMDDGAYYTVTSASGGYALPLVHRSDSSNADGTVACVWRDCRAGRPGTRPSPFQRWLTPTGPSTAPTAPT